MERPGAGGVPGAMHLVRLARFRPPGLAGLGYWYAVLPLHAVVFRGMLRGIQRSAEAAVGASQPVAGH